MVRPTATVAILAILLLTQVTNADGYALRTVKEGDSIGSIATAYNISVEALESANGLDSSMIHPGMVLQVPYVDAVGGPATRGPAIPPGFTWHALGAGETLSSVASAYGLGLEAIVGANPTISSLDRLPVGTELLIPPAAGLLVVLADGESLAELTARYGADPAAVAQANHLRSPFDVVPGMALFLPGVAPTEALARLQQVREAENRFIWPVHGRITSTFGPRHLGLGTSNFHRGIDIAAPMGTPVAASRTGVVIFAGWSNQGYGNLVKLRHVDGSETWYGHFSKILVSVGQTVRQGATLGRVGSTGISTGPHVHFEVHEKQGAVNPLSVLN